MTNKPEVKRYKLEFGHDSAMRKINRMQESEGGVYVRFEDYEALQATHEEELFCVRQDRDAHFGDLMRALEQVDALKAECEKLRKDAGTERQIQRAAQHLPEGWRIIVEVERDAGWIDAFNPDGRRIEIDWVGSLAEQIEQAIDAALQEEHNP